MKQKTYTLESVKSCGIRIEFLSKHLFYLDQVSGLPFWKDDDAKRIIAGTFKRFMATIVPEDETHALAQLKIGNREVLSRSYPYSTHWKKLPQEELDAFDACRKELEERGASPDASERMRTLAERFPVADFRKDPELFRVYELDGEWHLAVIWGISETAEDGLIPVHGFPPFPVYGKSGKSAKWLVLLLVILLALLSLLCWYKYGRTTLVASDPALCIAECRENGLRIERDKERLLPDGNYEVPVRFIAGDAARNPRAFCDQTEIPLGDGGTTEKFLILGAGDHSLSLREAVFVPPPTEVVLNFSLKEAPAGELPKFAVVFDEITADEATGEYNVPVKFSGIGADFSKVQLRVDGKLVPVRSLDGQTLLSLPAGTHDVTLERGDFKDETKITLPEFPKISVSFGEPKSYGRENKYDVDIAFDGLGSSSAKADIVSVGAAQKQVAVNYPGAFELAKLMLDGEPVDSVDNAQGHSFKNLLPGRHCVSLSVRRDTATATIDLPVVPKIPPVVNVETIVADEATGKYNVPVKFSGIGADFSKVQLRVDGKLVPVKSLDGQMLSQLSAGTHVVELECGEMKSEKVEITLPEFPKISVKFGKWKAHETDTSYTYDVEVIFDGLEEIVGIATCVSGGNAVREFPVRYPGAFKLARLMLNGEPVDPVDNAQGHSFKNLRPGKHCVELVSRGATAKDEIELPEKPTPVVVEKVIEKEPLPGPVPPPVNPEGEPDKMSSTESPVSVDEKDGIPPEKKTSEPTVEAPEGTPPEPAPTSTSALSTGPTSEDNHNTKSGGKGKDEAGESKSPETGVSDASEQPTVESADHDATRGSVSQETRAGNSDEKSSPGDLDSNTEDKPKTEEKEPEIKAVRDENGTIHISCPNGIGPYKGIKIFNPEGELLGDWNGQNGEGKYSVEMSPETKEICVCPFDAQGKVGRKIRVPVTDSETTPSQSGQDTKPQPSDTGKGVANPQPKVKTTRSTPSENPGPDLVKTTGVSSIRFTYNYERLPDAAVGRLSISLDDETLKRFGRPVRAEYDGKPCEVKDGRVIIDGVEKTTKSTRVTCWCKSSTGEDEDTDLTVDFRDALK